MSSIIHGENGQDMFRILECSNWILCRLVWNCIGIVFICKKSQLCFHFLDWKCLVLSAMCTEIANKSKQSLSDEMHFFGSTSWGSREGSWSWSIRGSWFWRWRLIIIRWGPWSEINRWRKRRKSMVLKTKKSNFLGLPLSVNVVIMGMQLWSIWWSWWPSQSSPS